MPKKSGPKKSGSKKSGSGGGTRGMSNNNSTNEEAEAASGGGPRRAYDPSNSFRPFHEQYPSQYPGAPPQGFAFGSAAAQPQGFAFGSAAAQPQGFGFVSSQWGVPGHYGPGGAAAAPRKVKGPRRPQGLGSLPSMLVRMSESSNSAESNNSQITRANGESVELAQQRKRSARRRGKGKISAESNRFVVPPGGGGMYDPTASWRHFPRTEEIQRSAMHHMQRTDDRMTAAINNHHRAKYAHPTGAESWHVGREEDWGMGQVELHRKAVSSLKETFKRPDLSLLAALRADIIKETSGVANNMELGSVDPVKALEVAKTLIKHNGSVTRLHIDMADDSTRLEGFLEYVAQLHTAREGQAWIRAQLDAGQKSKSGKHVIVASQLQKIKSFYNVKEELALVNIRSLRETQAPTIGYDRIDRMFRDIALDIFRAQRAYRENIEGLDRYPGYREMIDTIVAVSADDEDEGVHIPRLIKKLDQLASLIIATRDLHMTERGNRYIKEKMFDVLANLFIKEIKLN